MSYSRSKLIPTPTFGFLCLILVLNLPQFIGCAQVSYISPKFLQVQPLPSQISQRGHTSHLEQEVYFSPEKPEFRSRIDSEGFEESKSKALISSPIRYRTLSYYDKFLGEYQHRSIDYPKRRGRLSHVFPLMRRKRMQLRRRVLPRIHWWVKKLGHVPLALAAVPFMTTFGLALLLKCHVNNCVRKRPERGESDETEEEEVMPQMRNDDQAAAEKLALAIGVTAVTAESINLLAYQIGLLNTLRSLPSVPMLTSGIREFLQVQNGSLVGVGNGTDGSLKSLLKPLSKFDLGQKK